MSASASAGSASAVHGILDETSLRTMRYALGATLAMALASGIGWQLSFLTPVLSLGFLAAPARPSFKAGSTFLLVVAAACLAALLLGRYLLAYPLVYLPFVGLLLFRLFYAKGAGASPLIITWLLIAVTVIPMVMMQSPAIAGLVARGILFGAAVMLLVVWLAFAVFPVPSNQRAAAAAQSPPKADEAQPTAPTAASPAANERFESALQSTLVVLPLLVAFYTLEWVGSLLVLVFVALLSQQPSFAKNFKAGIALILGNAIGGLGAIIVYELLVVAPDFGLMLLLVLMAGLLCGAQLFSGKKMGPVYGMAFSTILLVIGSTTTSSGEADAKVYTRVIQVMIAVAYVVVAFGIIERLGRRKAG